MSEKRVINSFDQISAKTGAFNRTATDFHSRIKAGTQYPPEAGRYHLYVSLACPWAHRCLILRALRGLTQAIAVSVVNPVWGVVDPPTGRKSWVFKDTTLDGFKTVDNLFNKSTFREVYEVHNPDYVGRYTVPVLFDTKTQTIVNNESSEIIQIFQYDFNELATNADFNLYPESIERSEIDAANDKLYKGFNNGVYRAGFAQTQEAYLEGEKDVFDYLDYVEEVLSKQRFISGDKFTEVDLRFIPTALRFDSVYNIHFKCSRHRLSDYKHVSEYLRDVWQNIFNEEARKTYSEEHIKHHYYSSHPNLNPFGLIPVTTPLDLTSPTDRNTRQF